MAMRPYYEPAAADAAKPPVDFTPEFREGEASARAKADKAAQKAISKGDIEGVRAAWTQYQEEVYNLQIKGAETDPNMTPEKKAAYKKAQTKMHDEIMKEWKKTTNSLYDRMWMDGSFQHFDTWGKSNQDSVEILNEMKQNAANIIGKQLGEIVPGLLKAIMREFPDPLVIGDLKNPDNISAFREKVDDFAEKMGGEGTKAAEQFRKNLAENIKKQMAEGKDLSGTSGKSTWELKDYLKAFTALVLLGGSIGLLFWWLTLYAEEHSGCQLIDAESGYLPVSTKVVCFNNGKKLNIFNPNGGNVEYSSAQCTCNPSNLDPKKVTCNKEECSSNDEIRPWICNTGNPQCEGNWGDDQYKLYYWGIMTPLGALGNLGAGAANAVVKTTGNMWNQIKQAAIVIGIVLVVLALVYKLIPALLKWDTPSKFGNGGYLGNLSKYNNYAYMGRCPYSSNLPYKFLTVKNLINTVS